METWFRETVYDQQKSKLVFWNYRMRGVVGFETDLKRFRLGWIETGLAT